MHPTGMLTRRSQFSGTLPGGRGDGGLAVRGRAVAPGAAAVVRTSSACGGTGLAGIGQLADMAIGQGPAMGGEIGAVWGLR